MADRAHHVAHDKEALASEVASRFVELAQRRLAENAECHVVLTGGSMGSKVLESINDHRASDGLDWSRLHFWWGDDRWVPAASDDRNDRQAYDALLSHRPIPARNIHRFSASDAGLSLDEAARDYTSQLQELAESRRNDGSLFDLTFLGVGPDGHVASLFPDHTEVESDAHGALPVRNSPKPPPERLTMTLPTLNSSEFVWLVVAGEDKADAVARLDLDQQLPASRVSGRRATELFLDEAATARGSGSASRGR